MVQAGRQKQAPHVALWAIGTLVVVIATGGATAGAATGSAANGKKLYAKQDCSTCHQIGGKGGKIGPDLSKEGKKHNAQWLTQFFKNPRSKVAKGSMPAVQGSPKDLQDLAAYMLKLK